MSETVPQKVGSVEYSTRDKAYFANRQLKRVAGPWKLWAMGIAIVISGEFSGWNLGLAQGGFWGLTIATLVITAMYLLLCLSLSELSTAMPHTGGAYSFARTSMGPWAGFITGMAESMEYVFTAAVVCFFATSYMAQIVAGVPVLGAIPVWGWWAIMYGILLGLNILGAEMSFRFGLFISAIAIAILAVFCVAAGKHVDFAKYALDIEPAAGNTTFLPFGVKGILLALPFAVWFYLGIESLPLAAEEVHQPEKNMPKGIIYGIVTLVVLALAVLVMNSAIAPGATKMGASGEPLLDGLRTIFGDSGARILGLIALAGLVASLHGAIYAYGRQIYSLSRAGYFPTSLSVTGKVRKTPWVALVTGSIVGWIVMTAIYMLKGADAGGAIIGGMLLAMAVFGAMISYILQMVSYVAMKVKFPDIKRPFKSPFGIAGAVITAIIAAVTLVTLFVSDTNYMWAAVGAAIWYAIGLVYFAVHSSKHLVLSPEEEFALKVKSGTATEAVPATTPVNTESAVV